MLTGRLVRLRARTREDVETLYPMTQDPELGSLTDDRPWAPRSLPWFQADFDRRQSDKPGETSTRHAGFAVQRHDDADGVCIGEVSLWNINDHQRTARIGITLAPGARGQGIGRDCLEVICRFAFELRNLERVQLETLACNDAMQRAARAAGFTEEGRLRSNAWHLGMRVDELIFGLLAPEWRAAHPRP
ncbi:MAG: GNAT family protein [Kineosporiaceae bacterium]|jgi:RimJ/RimL family protein N-acetyltransferase